MSIDGVAHTPTQQDSHAELQAYQGWSVASMREEIDRKEANIQECLERESVYVRKIESLEAENEALKKEIYQVRNHWSQYNNAFFLRVRNALAYLRLVNTSNVDQAYINCAKLELEDIDKRRSSK